MPDLLDRLTGNLAHEESHLVVAPRILWAAMSEIFVGHLSQATVIA